MYKWLKFYCKILLHILCRDPDAIVRIPTFDEVRFYRSAIGRKYPNISEVWAVDDGLKTFIQAVEKSNEQNKYYNGYNHGHYTNSVFVFTPNGKLPTCLLNVPGTFHDSTTNDYGINKGNYKVFNETDG